MRLFDIKSRTDEVAPNPSDLRQSWLRGFQSPLARRFVFLTVFCSTVLAVLMTAIQLFFDYRSEVSTLNQSVTKIERSMLPGLIESLWVLDDTLVQSQLDGMVQIDGIDFVRVVDGEMVLASAGINEAAHDEIHRFAMERVSGSQKSPVGVLEVHINLTGVYDQLLRRAATIFFTNTIKTLIATMIIIAIYQSLVGKHLSQCNEHMI